jgi:hypothetical protein
LGQTILQPYGYYVNKNYLYYIPLKSIKMAKTKGLIFALCLLAACININQKDQNSSMQVHSITEPKSCYSFNNGKDSIQMSIEITNDEAKGDLNFNYYEKDSNKGTFSGSLIGDTLWADYTFSSEGIESKREVAFLRKGKKWIQGYGEITEKNGMFIFTNRGDIRFDNNFILEKVACPL